MRSFLILALTCCACAGQTLSIGVTGGGRTTDDVAGVARPESRRYVVGPMVEMGLPVGFAVEFDALYHRHGYRVPFSGGFVFNDSVSGGIDRERANSWEFPILLKYKLPLSRVKPFVEGGLAPRSISGTILRSGAINNIVTGQQTPFNSSSKTNWKGSWGVVTGGGVEFGAGRLRLSPEVRYTHWINNPINVGTSFVQGQGYYSTQEQVDVLLGIGWRIRQRLH